MLKFMLVVGNGVLFSRFAKRNVIKTLSITCHREHSILNECMMTIIGNGAFCHHSQVENAVLCAGQFNDYNNRIQNREYTERCIF